MWAGLLVSFLLLLDTLTNSKLNMKAFILAFISGKIESIMVKNAREQEIGPEEVGDSIVSKLRQVDKMKSF